MSTTIKKINAALKRDGYKGEIVRGDGYHYFVGEDFDHAFSTTVNVMHTSNLPVETWVGYASQIRTESHERRDYTAEQVQAVTYIH